MNDTKLLLAQARAAGLEIVAGTKHYKIMQAGKLVTVVPRGARASGYRNFKQASLAIRRAATC